MKTADSSRLWLQLGNQCLPDVFHGCHNRVWVVEPTALTILIMLISPEPGQFR